MELALQSSLFETADRRHLGGGAWVEVRSGWLTDAESLFDELMEQIPWRAERRQMYERVLDVPRLVSFHNLVAEAAPHPRLKQMRRRLNDTYAGELGEPFTTAGLCLYRDGNDSVAWHGDLLVMGGSCQRTWEHAIPKTSRPVGPRISIQFRPHDVR